MKKVEELTYQDPDNWLEIVKKEVEKSYIIPEEINKNVCVDLGTNVGAFLLLNHDKFDKIFGFEASKSCFKKTNKNIENENIKNVEIFNYAAYKNSDEILKLRYYRNYKDGKEIRGGESSGNSSVSDIPHDILGNGYDFDNEYEEVKSIDLEGIKKLINEEKINYLKCDIECGEYDFLIGKDLSCIDFIVMELHCNLGKEKINELLDHLTKFFDFYGNKIPELPDSENGKFFHPVLNLINKNITKNSDTN